MRAWHTWLQVCLYLLLTLPALVFCGWYLLLVSIDYYACWWMPILLAMPCLVFRYRPWLMRRFLWGSLIGWILLLVLRIGLDVWLPILN